MTIPPLSYCYLPDDYEGHRPANREEVERVGRGAVYSWPSTTTMHMDLMMRCRRTLDDARNDGIIDADARKNFEQLLTEEMAKPVGHRSGCPAQRTGKCLCDYLAQWDNQEQPATLEASKERLADFTAQMSDEGRIITIDTLNGRTSEWDGVFKDPTKLGPGVMVIPDEMWDDFEPSRVRLSGSPEFISASEYQRRQERPTPFQAHLTDVEENPMPAEPRLQLPIVIATTAEDPAVIAEKIIKDNPQWFGELPAGTYQKREPAAEQLRLGNEAAMEHWKKQARSADKRANWFFVWGALSCGYAIAYATGKTLGWF